MAFDLTEINDFILNETRKESYSGSRLVGKAPSLEDMDGNYDDLLAEIFREFI